MPRTIFVCTYENCSSTFNHLERYESHLRMHSGERPYICTYDNCDKSYARLAHLRRHEDTHESNYSCTVPGCCKILTSKVTLKKHIDVFHLKKQPKKYKCSVCNEEFNKHTTLQAHSYTHTGIKPYPCPESNCDKSFLMPCKLKQHMKCHRGYTCTEPNCEKLFPRWSLLVNHRRDCHPKNYKCPSCNKEFSFMSNFKAHCLTHQDEREVFKCPIPKCIRFYQAKRHLSDHLKNFHQERPLSCSKGNCHRFFKTEDEMSVHIRRRHQPRQKKEKPATPHFADVLAGHVKGTQKALNPQLFSTSKDFHEEPGISNEDMNNNESPPKTDQVTSENLKTFDTEKLNHSCVSLIDSTWKCPDILMSKVM